MLQDDELLQEFVVEGTEHLADVESQLLEIEQDGDELNLDLVNTVFRGVHSIKGAAGFLGLTKINILAHDLENVLNRIRERELAPTGTIIDVLLRSADLLRTLVTDVATSNEADISLQVMELQRLLDDGEDDGPGFGPGGLPADLKALFNAPPASTPQPDCDVTSVETPPARSDVSSHVPTDEVDSVDPRSTAAENLIEHMTASPSAAGMATPDRNTNHPKPSESDALADQINQQTSVSRSRDLDAPKQAPLVAEKSKATLTPDQPSVTVPGPPQKPQSGSKSKGSATITIGDPSYSNKLAESTVRVNVAILDQLMNLAGELVLGRNRLLQTVHDVHHEQLNSVVGRLDQITSDLQEAIMQTRMQPVRSVFNRFPRVVRDLCGKLGKSCNLEFECNDVEVDKTIIEAIGDPLTHLIRNSVDHGIELPDVRKACGKKPDGVLRLRAFQQAGKVCLRIEDDGGGIDPEKTKARALKKGIVSEADLRSMSDVDALRLIFAPGFSTAEAVTDVSGRGVGMDVVRTNIEQIGGTVEIESEVGEGTSVHITLPLTLAIIPSMIVDCADEKFAIPQTNIAELVRVTKAEYDTRFSHVRGAEVLRLRNNLLPIVRLHEVLGLAHAPSAECDSTNIIVVEAGQYRYGLAVDDVHDSEEIVVKPLDHQLKHLNCFAGATILGDGHVALIADISGIALQANLRSTEVEVSHKGYEEGDSAASEKHRLLLFENGPQEHFAVPLACVSRIERAQPTEIRKVGRRHVLTYRGTALPVLRLEELLEAKPARSDLAQVFVVIFSVAGSEFGLIAPKLIDIRDVALDVDTRSAREPGVSGLMMIAEAPTRLIEPVELAKVADAQCAQSEPTIEEGQTYRILLAEDSTFLRTHVVKTLADEGYEVTAAKDGAEAWETIQSMSSPPDLVITDIEMPVMDGLRLCSLIRKHERLAKLPVVALTSLAGEEDLQRGAAAGIDEYLIKLDKSKLLDTVAKYVRQRSQ